MVTTSGNPAAREAIGQGGDGRGGSKGRAAVVATAALGLGLLVGGLLGQGRQAAQPIASQASIGVSAGARPADASMTEAYRWDFGQVRPADASVAVEYRWDFGSAVPAPDRVQQERMQVAPGGDLGSTVDPCLLDDSLPCRVPAHDRVQQARAQVALNPVFNPAQVCAAANVSGVPGEGCDADLVGSVASGAAQQPVGTSAERSVLTGESPCALGGTAPCGPNQSAGTLPGRIFETNNRIGPADEYTQGEGAARVATVDAPGPREYLDGENAIATLPTLLLCDCRA